MNKFNLIVGAFSFAMLLSCNNASNTNNDQNGSTNSKEQSKEQSVELNAQVPENPVSQDDCEVPENNNASINMKNFDYKQLIGSSWQNGCDFFKVFADDDESFKSLFNIKNSNYNPKRLHFFGGTYHEAGAYFVLYHKSGKTFVDDGGQEIVLKEYNGTIWFEKGTDVLTFRNGQYVEQGMALILSGKYIDQNNQTFEFSPDFKLNGKSYKFHIDWNDFPENIIMLGDKAYLYEYSKDGVDLYNAKYVEEEGYPEPFYEKDKLAYQLKNLAFQDSNVEFFPYTSSSILNIDDLNLLSKEMLRIMRNEIYARHNREFKSEDLKALFEKRKGYKANSNFKENELNPIEVLNVRLIQSAENKKK